MGLLKLAIDRQNKTLVAFNGSITSLPALFQSNVASLQISVVDPTGDLGSPYSIVDEQGASLRVAVGATPTGTAGGPTPLALQDTFSYDSSSHWFTGTLDLNTAGVNSHIGANSSATAYFEVNLTLAGNRTTILQTTFLLKAVVDELTATVPTPTDQYLTKAEMLSTFARLVGANGQTIILKSPGGIYGRELGVNDDGTAIDNIITL